MRLPWRRARARAVYSQRYLLDVPGTHTDPLRGERLLTWLSMQGLVKRRDVLQPRPATMKALRRVHDDAYLEGLAQPGGLLPILGFDPPAPLRRGILAMMRAATGGTIEAARVAAASGGVAVNFGGGFHHARRERGAGFCAFNDVAAAIGELRAAGFDGRVLVVDCDLHDGDGTRSLFAEDASVHTFSIHSQDWDRATGAVEDTRIALDSGIEDAQYLDVLRRALPAVVESFAPALVVYVAGVDVAAGDALGDWRLTAAGILERDLLVAKLARGAKPTPLVVVLAGGYGQEAWRKSAPFLAALFGGRPQEPASTEEVTLHRYRRITRLLSPSELGGLEEGEDWGLTEDDVSGGMGGTATDKRLLGYYTEHGIELALERAGLLDRLRALGFAEPTVELDTANPSGQTVRIFGAPDRRDLLGELRVRRDRRTVPGMELLAVEWLLLQNPRAEFTPGRQPLPGQKHPGLGFLPDLGALFLLMCERLGLDGVLFVPSHMHLAARASRLMRFLEPAAEARWRALRPLIESLPLPAAARAVVEGRLTDNRGEAFRWTPSPMVLPWSERLKARFEEEEFERQVEEAGRGVGFRMAGDPGRQ